MLSSRSTGDWGAAAKEGEGYVLHTNVEEVVLNCHGAGRHEVGADSEEGRLSGF